MSDAPPPVVRGRARPGGGRLVYLPPPGTPLDVVETRLALMHLALATAERLLDQVDVPLTDARQRLLRASMQAFRTILREHAATESGHCQTCRYWRPAYYPRLSWPCPTVEIVEATLLELNDSEQGTENPSQ